MQPVLSFLTRNQWALFGAYLVVVGTQIQTLDHGWADALSPPWIGTFLAETGLFLAALKSGPGADQGDK
jgi:hypothetical protein